MKTTYTLMALSLLVIASIFAYAESTMVDVSEGYHVLSQIAKDESLVSVDENKDGVIDVSENAYSADTADKVLCDGVYVTVKECVGGAAPVNVTSTSGCVLIAETSAENIVPKTVALPSSCKDPDVCRFKFEAYKTTVATKNKASVTTLIKSLFVDFSQKSDGSWSNAKGVPMYNGNTKNDKILVVGPTLFDDYTNKKTPCGTAKEDICIFDNNKALSTKLYVCN